MSGLVFQAQPQRVILLLIVLAIVICGCSRSVEVPVVSRETGPDQVQRKKTAVTSSRAARSKEYQSRAIPSSGMYSVKRGDTLYSIAWRYGKDFKDIARWNAIKAPYTIYPRQKIRLNAARTQTAGDKNRTKSLQPGPVVSQQSKKTVSQQQSTVQPGPVSAKRPKSTGEQQKPVRVSTETKPPSKKKLLSNKQIVWQWPTRGSLVKAKQSSLKKGIDISGRFGQAIKSSAPGHVVYSGSGLLGYGRLIIIKHNETYLSAYAHNSTLLVGEGDDVVAGQTIAKMGNTSSGQALLHFEIRKNGKSVNPLSLLPKR